MNGFSEFDEYDGLGLAELIRTGQVRTGELCEAAISRIERHNPTLNAVVTTMFDEGRKNSLKVLPDGPFTGVPMLLKDLQAAYAGVPLSSGCKSLKDYIPDHDCEMVIRYKRAGMVILGKTNTPEFGLLGITEPELFGPCRNPWNTGHTPGGSSGGSASAVAAGMVPLASGGDGGGSIRIPSAYCGLFGLKPSRGRNPSGPDCGIAWQGAVQSHVLTRTVRDSAAMLDVTQGSDTGAPYEIRPPLRPYLDEAGTDPGKLKIAFNATSPIKTPVHPDCVKAVEQTAHLLESLGHPVEEVVPDLDSLGLAQSYFTMVFGEVAAELEELRLGLNRKVNQKDVETLTYTLGMLGRTFSAGDMVKALRRWDHAARIMGQFFNKYDLYLTPTTAYPPAKIGELDPKPIEIIMIKAINSLGMGWILKSLGIVENLAMKALERTPFTQLANLCGLPAMSVPLYWTPEKLPLGVQFMAPFGKEDVLFQLAGQLEKAQPWFHKRPPLE